MSNLAQRSFGGGEIAPGLFARTDSVKYQTGLRTCRNFIVQKHGGVVNRPGTDYVQTTKTSGAARLLKFIFNDEQTFMLEVGNRYIRLAQRGQPVRVTGVAAWVLATVYALGDIVSNAGVNYYCTMAHTSSAPDRPGVGATWQSLWHALDGDVLELPTPYLPEDLTALQYVQSGNIIVITHQGHPIAELVRDGTRWTLRDFSVGPTIHPPAHVAATGTGGAGTTYYAVTAIKKGTLEESLAALYTFAKIVDATHPATLTWDAVPDAISYNVYRSTDGKTYGLISSAGGLVTEVTDVTWANDNDFVSSADPTVWTPSASQIRNALTISVTSRAFDGNYEVKLRTLLDATDDGPGNSDGRIALYYSRDSEPRVFAGYRYVDAVNSTGTSAEEVIVAINVPDNGYANLTIDLVPEVIPGLGCTASFALDTTTAPDNVVSWHVNAAGFVDAGATADLSQAPPSDSKLFVTIDDYPATASYYQQRLFLGSTVKEPLKTWGSQIGNFNNFNISTPLLDSDAISFSLVGPQANAVRFLIDLGKLLIMTMGGEMRIDGDDAGIIRPDAINPSSAGENGIRANLRPLKVVDSMVYVQARGNIVRTLRPVSASGGLGNYEGTELSIMAEHLFQGKTVLDWDYAKSPNSIVWVVRSDGVLLGLTYLPEHGLWGWHRHDTDGFVENVICVPEDDEDRIYLIVRRMVDGSTVRYVERMAQRSFESIEDAHFLDCAKRYDGTNTTAKTVTLTTAGGWTAEDEITATFSAPSITAAIVNQGIFVKDGAGRYVKLLVQEYVSTTVAKGIVDRTVPVSARVATTQWALAIHTLSGLDHLEAKAVAIVGDGYVVANPNSLDLDEVLVDSGVATWDGLYVNVLIGLPFISDLQTLDIDTPSGPSTKEKKMLVERVGLFVKESRGIWAGRPNTPTEDDLLNGLEEFKVRDDENWGDPNALITDSIEIGISSTWDTNGRLFIRQIDPLPLSILSITPMGSL